MFSVLKTISSGPARSMSPGSSADACVAQANANVTAIIRRRKGSGTFPIMRIMPISADVSVRNPDLIRAPDNRRCECAA